MKFDDARGASGFGDFECDLRDRGDVVRWLWNGDFGDGEFRCGGLLNHVGLEEQ